MVRYTARQKKARSLLKGFLQARRERSLRQKRLQRRLQQLQRDHRGRLRSGSASPPNSTDESSSEASLMVLDLAIEAMVLEAELGISSGSGMSRGSEQSLASGPDSDSDAGPSSSRESSSVNSQSNSSSFESDSTSSDTSDTSDEASDTDSEDDLVPDLVPLDEADFFTDSDEASLGDLLLEDESLSEDETVSEDLSGDADEEEDDNDDPDSMLDWDGSRPSAASRQAHFVREEMDKLYKTRYQAPRTGFPRPPAQLPHLLHVLKHERPDHFRQDLRVSPYTFDRLLSRISDDPVFSNNSDNQQMPVEDQLAIFLFRLGHYGNAARLDRVAKWSGYAKGTVLLATRRVMTAVLRRDFMDEAVCFPTDAEKEEAKRWVEQHSCRAWRDGVYLVDGTLAVLADRPYWYGESYFDRKCNYSLNIQIISMPNLRIVDFGFGFTGSTHDSTAWEETHLFKNHEELLEEGEFIWADSAYPIEVWVVAPFKKPYSLLADNEKFNNHVSMVRIRSEHAIGFLKGRFQSLKGIRILIRDKQSHKFATYWVASAIGIHAFAMQCEAEERKAQGLDDSDAADADPFIQQGLSDDDGPDPTPAPTASTSRRARRRQTLQAAKERREELKSALFAHLAEREQRRADRE